MQYALLIYEDEQLYGPGKNGPALQQIVAKHMQFNKELGSRRVGGAGLKATAAATTVRTANGAKIVHDGPFAESKAARSRSSAISPFLIGAARVSRR